MTKAAGSRTAALLLAAALLTIAVSPAASSVLQPPRVSLSTIQQPLKAAAAAALSQQLSGAPAVLPLQVQPITALTPGDIIATGYMVSHSADTIVKTMYVLDRATFAVKGSFQPDMCPFIVGVPAMSPDGSTLTLACWWSESGSLISVSADGSSPPVNLTTLAADVTPQPGLQYVMGASTGANYSLLLPSATSDPQLITAETQKTVIKFNGTSFDVEASYGMGATFFLPFSGAAVTADGSQCLSVNLSSSVQALDLTTGQLGPDLFTLPEGLQQDSTCSDVLTLYDGNVIVACSGQTINAGKPAVCAFLLAGSSAAADSNSTSQAGTILRTWCTSKPLPPGPVPSDQATLLPGARQTSVVPIATISLAMDVDRQSFYMAVYVYWNVVVGEYVNLFKIKLSDFAEIAGAALPLATDGIMVYGALPANQVGCCLSTTVVLQALLTQRIQHVLEHLNSHACEGRVYQTAYALIAPKQRTPTLCMSQHDVRPLVAAVPSFKLWC